MYNVGALDRIPVGAASGPEPTYDKVVSGYETFTSLAPFACECGGVLPRIELAHETWGRLSPARDNVVLLHTGLSASSHARSHPRNPARGWWEDLIGPGAPLDTDRFFVVCTNLLGGCYGSTGPSSPDPATGEPYACDFPIVTVRDMVTAQIRLLDHLDVRRVQASVGSSLGGMLALMHGALEPRRVERVVSISAALRSHPQAIALRFAQRQAVMADPEWRGGRYYGRGFPRRGLHVARQIGTITYRSGPEWESRFGRQRLGDGPPRLGPDFEVEAYLVHQGEKFGLQYDANSYLYVSKAMDLFDLTEAGDDGRPAVEALACSALVVGVTSDLLFPVWQQRELAECLEKHGCDTSYLELDSPYGHDAFLLERSRIGAALRHHLDR